MVCLELGTFTFLNLPDCLLVLIAYHTLMDVHKNPRRYEREDEEDAQPLAENCQNTPRACNYDGHLSEKRTIKAPGCHVVGHEGTFREALAYHSQPRVHFSYQHRL